MREHAIYPEWQFKPVRLNQAEINDPLEVIRQFLKDYSLPEHRIIQWDILNAALASSKCNFMDSGDAAIWVNYLRNMELFMEAVFVLCGNLNALPDS